MLWKKEVVFIILAVMVIWPVLNVLAPPLIESVRSTGDVLECNFGKEVELDNTIQSEVSIDNDAGSAESRRARADEEAPTFWSKYHSPATTGELMLFSIIITDNVAVEEVYFTYMVSNDPLNLSVTNRSDNRWNITIRTPGDELVISYYYSAKDTSGNWNETATAFAFVSDNDEPVLLEDNTQGSPTTGDPFTITIDADDNIAVTRVRILHSFNDMENYTLAMNLHASGYWFKTLYIPSDGWILDYSFIIQDDAGNFIETNATTISVVDNDAPSYQDLSVGIPETGMNYTISTEVSDNTGIDMVLLNYSYNSVPGVEVIMERTKGESWSHTVNIPDNATSFGYFFVVRDLSGNNFTSPASNSTVKDGLDPVAEAGVDVEVGQGGKVEFNGSASSDNIGITGYVWTFQYAGDLIRLEGQKVDHTFEISGRYIITLNVSDERGNWATDLLTVTVEDVSAPRAVAGADRQIQQGDKVIFDGRASRDDVAIASYTWELFLGEETITLVGDVVSYTFYSTGQYTVRLTVRDGAGNSHADEMKITVTDIADPIANAGIDQNANEGSLIEFDGSLSRDNVGIVNYSWKIDYGGEYHLLYGECGNFTFLIAGKYEVALTVRDASGRDDMDFLLVTINDVIPPTVKILLNGAYLDVGSRYEIGLNPTVTMDGSLSADNIAVASYRWTITGPGDPKYRYEADIAYNFYVPGIYEVLLNVTDTAGNFATHSFEIAVPEETDIENPEEENDLVSWMGDNGCLVIFIGVCVMLLLLLVTAIWFRDFAEELRKARKRKIRRRVRKKRVKQKRGKDADHTESELVETVMVDDLDGMDMDISGDDLPVLKPAPGEIGPVVVEPSHMEDFVYRGPTPGEERPRTGSKLQRLFGRSAHDGAVERKSTRHDKRPTRKANCPVCGRVIDPFWIFCPGCKNHL